jgi:hypothetical protein
VLRWNGTAFVNAALNYSDLAGTAPSGGITQADADARYVNITGDTMTGPLLASGGRSLFTASNEAYSIGARRTAAGGYVYLGATDATPTPGLQLSGAGGGSLLTISSAGNITNEGTSHSFAAGSIASTAISGLPAASAVAGAAQTVSGTVGTSALYARADHTHPAPSAILETASRGLRPTDVGRIVCNVYNGASTLTPITFTLPTAGDTSIPAGSWIDVCDASALSPTSIAAPAGVTFLWNASLTGGSNTAFAGGAGATLTINGMFSRWKIVKTAPDRWILVG